MIKYHKNILIFAALALALAGYFTWELRPVGGQDAALVHVLIRRGDGLTAIAETLLREELIRSSGIFKAYAVLTLEAHQLKPGLYSLSPQMNIPRIVSLLARGGQDEAEVRIPEGATIRDIDELLSADGVVLVGSLLAYAASTTQPLEGMLFPDTYRFTLNSTPEAVVRKILDTFNKKALPLLTSEALGKNSIYDVLILASLIEKEVPEYEDRQIVSGILVKRLDAGWLLQVDASLCYIKAKPCHPLTPLDLKTDSPYNTYINKGFPPTPIGNPGISALKAALNPQKSPYWYYISDPKTGKTVFARTLEEQIRNQALYLK